MKFPTKYPFLTTNEWSSGIFRLVPIRYEDRLDIMRWRNEQIYHLRQNELLTENEQNKYFEEVVAKLFEQKYPTQILFSYLEGEKCIGYGGLVHIKWVDKNAEISFIMNTAIEKTHFHFHWKIYLGLIEKVAFEELGLHKIYTYAFDLRPNLYEAVESVGFKKEAVLKEHCLFEGEYKDVVIHSKWNPFTLRRINNSDKEQIFKWSNDELTRKNSFYSHSISLEEHTQWFESKLIDNSAHYFVGQVEGIDAALIRFDENEKFTLIGINLAPEFRGKGFSSIFLKMAVKEYFMFRSHKCIKAYIKVENVASQKAFEKAGFIISGEEIINNQKALVYRLNL